MRKRGRPRRVSLTHRLKFVCLRMLSTSSRSSLIFVKYSDCRCEPVRNGDHADEDHEQRKHHVGAAAGTVTAVRVSLADRDGGLAGVA